MLSCQISAPGFNLAGVEGIALNANLKEDGIDAVLLQVVELTGEHGLHAVATDALELSVDGLNPGSAKLSLWILPHCSLSDKEQQK